MKKIFKFFGIDELVDLLCKEKDSPLKKFTREFPNIIVHGEYDTKTILPLLTDLLQQVTKPMRQSVKKILIIPENRWAEHVEGVYGKGQTCGGYFLEKDKTVVFSAHKITLYVLAHEFAHALDYRKEKDYKIQSRLENEDTYLDPHLTIMHESPREQWRNIQQTGYGEKLGPKTIGPGYAHQWSNGSREPRNGFVMAYGANNEKEDLATYVEAAYTWSSETWTQLLTSEITCAQWLRLRLPGEKSLLFKNLNGKITLMGKKRKPIPYDVVLEKKKGLHHAVIQGLSKEPTLCHLVDMANKYGGNIVNAWYDPRYRKKIEFLYQEGYIPEGIYTQILRK